MATKFITISIAIMHDKNLNQSQKFILAEIEQLTSLDQGCIASNSHFSELIGITKENVSKNINDLKNMGYINIHIVSGTRNHTRTITITKIVRPPYQNSKTPLSKQQETKENKTINKTIKIKSKPKRLNDAKDFDLSSHTSFEKLTQKEKDLYLEYTALRKEMGLKTTQTIHNRLLKKYFVYGRDIAIIEAAINSNWKDFYKPNAPNVNYRQKEPEVGSIAWRMQQEAKHNAAIDAEVV